MATHTVTSSTDRSQIASANQRNAGVEPEGFIDGDGI